MTTTKNLEETLSITITLPPALANTIERQAERCETTIGELAVKMLLEARAARARKDLTRIHEGWHLRMMRLGLFSEEDIYRYLES